jgi:hypothetical protein
MPSKNLPLFKLLLVFLIIIILSSLIAAAFLFGQITAKRQLALEPIESQTAKCPTGITLLNPILNVSQNQKYMDLLNLDNQIIGLLGSPYLQTNSAASYLQPYTQGLTPQESSTQTLKDLFQKRDSLTKDLGLVEEEK